MAADLLLPAAPDEASFDGLLRQDALWRPALAALCRRHGFDPAALAPIPEGSSVIWSLGEDAVIKLMPPFWAADCQREIAVLQAMRADLDLPVPRLLARGELEGWPYFIMSRLPGRFASELWPTLDAPARLDLIQALGRLLNRLHQLPLRGLDALRVDWPGFVQSQCEGFLSRQAAYGVDEALARELHASLLAEAAGLAAERDAVLMHCEVMPAHLLMSAKGLTGTDVQTETEVTDSQALPDQTAAWTISGLIDFGDPLVGHHAYEFGGVFVFFTAGQAALRRAFLRAYGYEEAELTPALAQRLMAAALLHRFGTVPLGLRLIKGQAIQTSFFDTFFSL